MDQLSDYSKPVFSSTGMAEGDALSVASCRQGFRVVFWVPRFFEKTPNTFGCLWSGPERAAMGLSLWMLSEKGKRTTSPTVSHFHASISLPGFENGLTGQEDTWFQDRTRVLGILGFRRSFYVQGSPRVPACRS